MSETPRMGDKEFEDLANCASMDYQISADAGDVYVDDVEKVKRIVAECRRARDAEAFERGARLIESNARQVAEAERDALVKDQANSTVEIAAVQARADKADAENTRLKATADTLRAALEHHLWCRVCAEIGCEACGPDCTARAALQATEPKRGAQTVEAKP